VVRLDRRTNRLIVGGPDSSRRSGCRVRDVNWITGPPDAAFNSQVRLRYRHRPVPAQVTPLAGGGAHIRFEDPQKAVTPGQGAVFYRGEEVIGGGWICAEDEQEP
jgi:tRNA-specific 2-thiouridylase